MVVVRCGVVVCREKAVRAATETDTALLEDLKKKACVTVRSVGGEPFSGLRFFALPNYNLELRCLQRPSNNKKYMCTALLRARGTSSTLRTQG